MTAKKKPIKKKSKKPRELFPELKPKGNLSEEGKKLVPSQDIVVEPKASGWKVKKILDDKKILQMAMEDCTVEEIAYEMGVHRETLYGNYSDLMLKGRALGNKSLKWKMFQLAMKGNVSILIWLSKQRLGYRDKPLDEISQVNFNVIINEVPK